MTLYQNALIFLSATSKAMMDAILRLVEEGSSCCNFSNIIIGPLEPNVMVPCAPPEPRPAHDELSRLNPRQAEAVESSSANLSLIWGPPGIPLSNLS